MNRGSEETKGTKLPAVLIASLLVAAAAPLSAGDEAGPAWEKLKTLVGQWEGSYQGAPGDQPEQTTARVSYELVSGGSALLERLGEADGPNMVTLYHRDGDTLLMTHYCSVGNQSRMRAHALKDGALEFSFVDASNLRSPHEHRMSRLVMRFPGADRLLHEWTSREKGKEQTGRFEFRRKK